MAGSVLDLSLRDTIVKSFLMLANNPALTCARTMRGRSWHTVCGILRRHFFTNQIPILNLLLFTLKETLELEIMGPRLSLQAGTWLAGVKTAFVRPLQG